MSVKLIEKIKDQLADPKKLDKRQISIFLKKSHIDDLDNAVKMLNPYSERSMNRNYIIELAIEAFVEDLPDAIEEYKKEYLSYENEEFDTVIFPSDETGQEVFLGQNKWYFVRLNKDNISKIKQIGIYFGSPISKITHYGIVDRFEEIIHDGKKKYIIYLKGDAIKLKNPVPLGSTNPLATRSPKYTTLKKLKSAKEYSDLTLY